MGHRRAHQRIVPGARLGHQDRALAGHLRLRPGPLHVGQRCRVRLDRDRARVDLVAECRHFGQVVRSQDSTLVAAFAKSAQALLTGPDLA